MSESQWRAFAEENPDADRPRTGKNVLAILGVVAGALAAPLVSVVAIVWVHLTVGVSCAPAYPGQVLDAQRVGQAWLGGLLLMGWLVAIVLTFVSRRGRPIGSCSWAWLLWAALASVPFVLALLAGRQASTWQSNAFCF